MVVLQYKEYTLGVFLYIEGSFNNIETSDIVESLNRVPELSNQVLAGLPRGVQSTLTWQLAVNDLLMKFNKEGVKIATFADIVEILVEGNSYN